MKSHLSIRGKLPALSLARPKLLQRQCACGQHTPAGGTCSACNERWQHLQRMAIDTGAAVEAIDTEQASEQAPAAAEPVDQEEGEPSARVSEAEPAAEDTDTAADNE